MEPLVTMHYKVNHAYILTLCYNFFDCSHTFGLTQESMLAWLKLLIVFGLYGFAYVPHDSNMPIHSIIVLSSL